MQFELRGTLPKLVWRRRALALALILIAQPAFAADPPAKAAAPVPVIFDTDMDSDVDDVSALCLLHALADRGEARILAVATSGLNEWSGPCVAAINTYYGRSDIPLGLATGPRAIKQPSNYAKEVATEFPQDFHADQTPTAVAVYRKVLAAQPDHSVVIISVGDLTNLAALLVSPADAVSPLDGKALVAAKVKEYVCMGSRYPADTAPDTRRWGNFRTDPESVREVVAGWPTMITFTGGGPFADTMKIGAKITTLDPKKFPVARAYQSFFEKTHMGPTHHTADLIAVYVGVRGTAPYFKVVDHGHNEIDEVGRNAWKETPDVDNQRYTSELVNPSDAPKLAAVFEELAMAPPAPRK